jgi:hypothetical protein
MLSRVRAKEVRQQADSKSPQLCPDKAMRGRDAQAQLRKLHGRLIVQNFVDSKTEQLRPYWGRLHYMGAQRRPDYFDVHFDDGDIYNYTMTEVKHLLQPVGATPPAGATIPGDDKLSSMAT